MKKNPQIVEIIQKHNVLFLTWIINNICTNKCSYCPPNLHTGTNHNYDWEHAERFARHLIEKYPRINLALSGGEPTLSPFLKDLVSMFSNAGNSIGMTTNGARTVRYYEEISKYMSYMVFSHHPSFADPLLIDKALAAAQNTIVTVSVMFDSRYFDETLEFFEKGKSANLNISIQPVRIHDWTGVKNTAGRDYTEEQLSILTNLQPHHAPNPVKPKNPPLTGGLLKYHTGKIENFHAQTLINNHQTNFLGWDCKIGLESFYVAYDGTVRTGNCISSKKIGEIQDFDNIQWPTKSFICPQTFCHCTTDVYVSKRKI